MTDEMDRAIEEVRRVSSEREKAAGDEDRGLYGKYLVERLDDPTGKHAGCHFFVLDPQHDQIARWVLKEYADRAFELDHYQLAADLKIWLRRLEREDDRDHQR